MKTINIFVFLLISFWINTDNMSYFVKEKDDNETKIQWISLEEATKQAKVSQKKILVDLYTDWCGWCKIMDKKTYSDPEIVNYINNNYLPVKINAETKDTLVYQGIKFGYQQERRVNRLAYLLLNGKMNYPSTVILNEKAEILTPISGFIEPKIMLKILKYYAENHYANMKWEDYEKNQ